MQPMAAKLDEESRKEAAARASQRRHREAARQQEQGEEMEEGDEEGEEGEEGEQAAGPPPRKRQQHQVRACWRVSGSWL